MTVGDVKPQSGTTVSFSVCSPLPAPGSLGYRGGQPLASRCQGLALLLAEVYTIQGNSHGKPCTIPFKYDNQWFHGCTSTGREDGHLWCATTQDYGKDERWGFCPIKSESRGLLAGGWPEGVGGRTSGTGEKWPLPPSTEQPGWGLCAP